MYFTNSNLQKIGDLAIKMPQNYDNTQIQLYWLKYKCTDHFLWASWK